MWAATPGYIAGYDCMFTPVIPMFKRVGIGVRVTINEILWPGVTAYSESWTLVVAVFQREDASNLISHHFARTCP